jgi:hypothetical protein
MTLSANEVKTKGVSLFDRLLEKFDEVIIGYDTGSGPFSTFPAGAHKLRGGLQGFLFCLHQV